VLERKRRILVADDDRVSRIIISTNLEAAGYSVRGEANGASALTALSEETFDLMLLDLVMPDMDGDEVLERIRADARLHDLRVVIVSGDDDSEATRRCQAMGVCALLGKPVNPTELRTTLTKCLRSA